MEDQNIIKEKMEKVQQIFSDCMEKLGIIESKQKKVVSDLVKKTDGNKIKKVKAEIEAL